jgi:polysaccharide biosynthesis/export protein
MDKVRVQVFQEPELSGEFQIDAAGRVDLPLLGEVEVLGLTALQASELIRHRLDERYLFNPKVQVFLTDAARDSVTVEGAVHQPGLFPVNQPTTLLRTIALARGTLPEANDEQVIVFRHIDGRKMAAGFDLEAIRRAKADDPAIYPEDVVVVTDSRTRALFRDVLSAVPFIGVFRPF